MKEIIKLDVIKKKKTYSAKDIIKRKRRQVILGGNICKTHT